MTHCCMLAYMRENEKEKIRIMYVRCIHRCALDKESQGNDYIKETERCNMNKKKQQKY